MRLNRRTILGVVAGGAFLITSGSTFASRRPEYIDTPKGTLLLAPAITIAAGDVDEQAWSSDGAYCAVVLRNRTKAWLESTLVPRKDGVPAPAPPAELYIWDRSTGSAKRVWESDNPAVKIKELVWIHGTSELLVNAMAVVTEGPKGEPENRGAVLAVDAANSQFHWIPSLGKASYIRLNPSPTKSLVELVELDSEAGTTTYSCFASTMDASAQTSSRQAITLDTLNLPDAWSADGSVFLFRDLRKKVDLQLQGDGTLAKSTKSPYYPNERKPDLILTQAPTLSKIRGARKSLNALWLSWKVPTDHPDAFVSADGTHSSLSPGLDAVFYIEADVAKVRTWAPLSDDERRALMDALKQDAMTCAKDDALGLLMFANDNGDMLPGGGSLDGLLPYLRDASLLDDFDYTPPSNLNLETIESPAETVVGTIPGPGGVAVAYSDGHVGWRPNK